MQARNGCEVDKATKQVDHAMKQVNNLPVTGEPVVSESQARDVDCESVVRNLVTGDREYLLTFLFSEQVAFIHPRFQLELLNTEA
jgi:hypothetical protein